MTRKDFQLIADALRDTDAPVGVVYMMAARLAAAYPRFDHARFMAAVLRAQ